MSLVVVAVGAYDAYLMITAGPPFLVLWGVVFGGLVPIIGVIEAWVEARRLPDAPLRRHPAALVLSGVALAVGGMLPLAERVHEFGL